MTWSKTTNENREQARADLATLTEAGVTTSLSQIIHADSDMSAWRGGRITLGQLCKRRGWDREAIHPEYRRNGDTWHVYMPKGQLGDLLRGTKKDVGTAKHGFRIKNGQIRPLPVVSVRKRNGQMSEQLLSGRAWEAQETGMVWAETLTGQPPHPEHGYPCCMCSIHGADRLRQDADDHTGLVCETCTNLYDLTKTAFINR